MKNLLSVAKDLVIIGVVLTAFAVALRLALIATGMTK